MYVHYWMVGSYLSSLLGHGIDLVGIARTEYRRNDCRQNTLFTKVERYRNQTVPMGSKIRLCSRETR